MTHRILPGPPSYRCTACGTVHQTRVAACRRCARPVRAAFACACGAVVMARTERGVTVVVCPVGGR